MPKDILLRILLGATAVLTLNACPHTVGSLEVAPTPTASATLSTPTPYEVFVNAGVVTTLAGSIKGYADGSGMVAQFMAPFGLAMGPDETLYVADLLGNRIRRISKDGTVSTFAGQEASGSIDGVAAEARFDGPAGITIDVTGNLYVTEIYGNRIRKVTPDGRVTTVAGSAPGYTDGQGQQAKFNQPVGIVCDSAGVLYISDGYNCRIRKISPDGMVSTFSGGGAGFADGSAKEARFKTPTGLSMDDHSNLYVADTFNQRIRKVDKDGSVTTVAGSGTLGSADGASEAASFNFPQGVSVASNGDIFVADSGNNEIRQLSLGTVKTFAGSVAPGFKDAIGLSAQFNNPTNILVSKTGFIHISDSLNHKIRLIR